MAEQQIDILARVGHLDCLLIVDLDGVRREMKAEREEEER